MSNSSDRELIFAKDSGDEGKENASETVLSDWKVLIVDDRQEVHDLTKLILQGSNFEGRPIEFISAFSGEESMDILRTTNDVALILLDVVMETDHAGLDVVKFIRGDLNNQLVRIILRTGQPGQAPEEKVVVDYDINDYKDKADITSSSLKTTVFTALRGYRDLCRLGKMNDLLELKVRERTAELEKSKEIAEAASHAKSLFLSNMSHEIRTPLNAILGFTQLTLRNRKLPNENREMLKAIEVAGNHLLAVINDVLELSKIEAGKMHADESDFDFSKLLGDLSVMFKMRCEQKSLRWSLVNNCVGCMELRGDQNKLRQVLINLLGNAVKFTEKGLVQLKVSQDKDGRFVFEVSDTGPGIALDEQDQIFDMFYQASAGMHTTGTGLGLSISKRQIEMMGGHLELHSELEKGSRFTFFLDLPCATRRVYSESLKEKKILCLRPGFQLSALVVDDVEENRIMLCGLLLDIGVNVVSAKNGREALEKLREKMVDIVYMDIRMPIMNGDEAVACIREEFPHSNVACVAISAYSMAHEVEYYLSIGFDRYISKPFQFEAICQSLQEFCGAEFEFEEGVPNGEIEQARDFSQLRIPSTLHSELIAAADLNRMTTIRKLLDELSVMGQEEGKLSDYLGSLLNNYDTGAIVNTLHNIGHKEGS